MNSLSYFALTHFATNASVNWHRLIEHRAGSGRTSGGAKLPAHGHSRERERESLIPAPTNCWPAVAITSASDQFVQSVRPNKTRRSVPERSASQVNFGAADLHLRRRRRRARSGSSRCDLRACECCSSGSNHRFGSARLVLGVAVAVANRSLASDLRPIRRRRICAQPKCSCCARMQKKKRRTIGRMRQREQKSARGRASALPAPVYL